MVDAIGYLQLQQLKAEYTDKQKTQLTITRVQFIYKFEKQTTIETILWFNLQMSVCVFV